MPQHRQDLCRTGRKALSRRPVPASVRCDWPTHVYHRGRATYGKSRQAHRQFLIVSVIEAVGEAFAVVSKAGIDRAQYLDILINTFFGAPVYKTYGGLIAEERYKPAGFKSRARL